MSCIAVSDNLIAVARGLRIDCFKNSNHSYVDLPKSPKPLENDQITDISISNDSKFLAVLTSISKQLIVYTLPINIQENHRSYVLPRSASKIRFTANNEQILVADKSGDVLIYNISLEDTGNKLLGHLSLLLDVLQTHDGKYVVSCDRDEKIRVSCYPNTYNIQTFCLGHKEFVNHMEILPHDSNILTSSSGDGTIKCWDYVEGKLHYSIDTYLDVNEEKLKDNFCKIMDEDGIEVNTLPIVYFTITRLDENSSVLAVLVYSYNVLLIYSLKSVDNKFSHKLVEKLPLEHCPTAIKLYKSSLYIFDDVNSNIKIYDISKNDEEVSLNFEKKLNVFEDHVISTENKEPFEFIKVLYKRKFDNVQEYQERKKQRLEKTSK